MSVHPEEGRDEDAEPVRSERQIAEALRLRPERPPVMRLSRKALTVLGGASALALGGALIWALHTSHGKPTAKELYSTDHNPTADGLARLPGDYRGVAGAAPSGASSVPQLGPPLPGDLGRPILKAGVASPAIGGTAEPSAVTQQRDQARQRVVQEQQAAQTSRLFLGDSVKAAETSASASAASTASPSELGGLTGLGALAANPAAQGQAASPSADADHKLAFLNGAADHRTVSTDRIEAPTSPYVVQAGAVIAAALVTGLRSDLPGQVTAQVTENVYDGPTGRFLLIPQGARLIGQYDAQIAFGQNRALLVWNRLIRPMAARSFWSASPAPILKVMRAWTTRSTITGASSLRPPCSRPSSASAPRPGPRPMKTTSCRRSVRARPTASARPAAKWLGDPSPSSRRSPSGRGSRYA